MVSREGTIEYEYLERMRDCYLTQHVHDMTRFRCNEKGNVLDLIICECEGISGCCMYNESIRLKLP